MSEARKFSKICTLRKSIKQARVQRSRLIKELRACKQDGYFGSHNKLRESISTSISSERKFIRELKKEYNIMMEELYA